MSEKYYTEMTWDELVSLNTRLIHEGLLESGGKGFRIATFQAMMMTLQWRSEQEKKDKK